MDAEDYATPGRSFPYQAEPRPLTDEERVFLTGLDKEYWRPMQPDRFGTVLRRPHGRLMRAEIERVCRLILECRLMTEIGSGMFGLSGYSMKISEIPAPQGMVNDDPPKRLFTLISNHMPRHPDSGDMRASDQKDWILFTAFTHSPENLAMLDFHKVQRPRPRASYDY